MVVPAAIAAVADRCAVDRQAVARLRPLAMARPPSATSQSADARARTSAAVGKRGGRLHDRHRRARTQSATIAVPHGGAQHGARGGARLLQRAVGPRAVFMWERARRSRRRRRGGSSARARDLAFPADASHTAKYISDARAADEELPRVPLLPRHRPSTRKFFLNPDKAAFPEKRHRGRSATPSSSSSSSRASSSRSPSAHRAATRRSLRPSPSAARTHAAPPLHRPRRPSS